MYITRSSNARTKEKTMAKKHKKSDKGALILEAEAREARRTKKASREKKTKEGGRGFIIFVAVFLILLVLLVAALGIVSAIRHSNTVFSLDGMRMDKEVAAFFVSMYRADYTAAMRQQGKNPDAAGFFDELAEDGRTNREVFCELASSYLKEILVASYIFDSVRELEDEEEREIERVVGEVLEYKADGSEERFNELASEFGFDYDSFCDAVKMYYKALSSFAVLYGAEGALISQNETVCGSYLQEYTHVSMIVVRTETKLITDGEGRDYNITLTESEKAAKQALIAEMDAAMTAYKNDEDGKMTVAAFENWLASSTDSGRDWVNTGYYFHENAEMTKEFSDAFPGVVEAAYAMPMYSFDSLYTDIEIMVDDEVRTERVKIYLYKYPPERGAYAETSMKDVWFSDFFSDAAVYLFGEEVKSNLAAVEEGGFAEEFDYVGVGKNIDLIPRFD